ncbi:MAG: CCA tRNA nucleotidyltransferase [Roseburia sp.]
MRIQLPEDVKYIIDCLQDNGYEAYAVGGCVRDTILGRNPSDWDITTSATPSQVKALFDRTVDTGIAHGTVTVLQGKAGYEVTTYRIDGEYEDARHPKTVTYTSSLLEDLKRRDFTINAMAYNETEGLVDAFCGEQDLQQGVIRCVGNPEERFTEDALRMLRAVRFAAQLGFSIEEDTAQAIRKLAPLLAKVSAERIQVELLKLLVSPHPEELEELYKLGISKVILPEWDMMMETPQQNPHHCYSVGRHTLEVVKGVGPDKVLRLAALFHDVSKPECRSTDEQGVDHFYGHPQVGAKRTREIMRRLKFDNATIDAVCRLVNGHDVNPDPEPKYVRRTLRGLGESCFPDIFELKYADIMAQSEYHREEKLTALREYRRIYTEIMEQGECISLKTLAVDGRDLMEAGVPAGKQIGKILNALLALVIDDPSKNTKEYLLGYTLENLFIR